MIRIFKKERERSFKHAHAKGRFKVHKTFLFQGLKLFPNFFLSRDNESCDFFPISSSLTAKVVNQKRCERVMEGKRESRGVRGQGKDTDRMGDTVCFNSFGTLHDGVTLEVIKIPYFLHLSPPPSNQRPPPFWRK